MPCCSCQDDFDDKSYIYSLFLVFGINIHLKVSYIILGSVDDSCA